jgi:RNA polymerase sigma factor (sigma-70 family)
MTPVLAHRPRGDRAFERIYRRHVGDVYRYTLAVLRNPADAEDVTQITFMNAYRAYEAGERPRQPHNWLIAIAHNVCRQRFRQSQRRVEEVVFDDTVAEAVVADDDAPTADDIRRALGHLAFNQRAALVMRELEGRSYAEIAEILDVSVSAVETLIFRGRRALREQLEGRLTCREAELAISRQLDGRLARGDRGPLRAHLRECAECAGLARKLRAQRTAIRTLGLVPLPTSLGSLFGGAAGGAAWGLGGGLAIKAAVGLAAGAVVAGGSYEVVRETRGDEPRRVAAQPATVERASATVRQAIPAPLALPPGERDERAPFGRAVGHQKAAADGDKQVKPARTGRGQAHEAMRATPTRGKSAAAHTEKPARPVKPKRVTPTVQKAARKELAPAAPEKKPVRKKKRLPPMPFALVLVDVDRALEPVAE